MNIRTRLHGANARRRSTPKQIRAKKEVSPSLLVVAKSSGHNIELTHRIDNLQAQFAELIRIDGVVLVEWADRVSGALPADHLRITIEPVPAGRDGAPEHPGCAGENERRIFFEAFGEASGALLRRFEEL